MAAPPRSDRATLLTPAPANRLYQAFLSAEALARWLPPPGMSARIERYEPYTGGTYRIWMLYDGPNHTPGKTLADADLVEGRFLSFEPDRRIVQTALFQSDDPDFAGEMRLTWRFASTPEGTEVSVTAEDVPPGIDAGDHAKGLSASLTNLAAWAMDAG